MNYKNQKAYKSRVKRLKLAVFIVSALIASIGGFYLYKSNHAASPYSATDQNAIDSNSPTEEELRQAAQASLEKKQNTIESPESTKTPNPSSEKISLTAHIENNGTVTVFTKLYEFSGGRCELTVVNGTHSTTQQADIIYQPEFSSCAGFSIPIQTVGEGQWAINLIITTNGQEFTKTINLNVN